jgi:hypothetical protein
MAIKMAWGTFFPGLSRKGSYFAFNNKHDSTNFNEKVVVCLMGKILLK